MKSEKNLDQYLGAYLGGSQYDFDNKIILNWYPHRLKQEMKAGTSLLELGLGHGLSSAALSGLAKKHVIIEGSKAIIDRFKVVFGQVPATIVESTFEDFETSDRFDVILMGFILEHVDDPIAILTKYQRFLNPSGRLFVAVPNAESLNRRIGLAAGIIHDLQELSAYDQELGHKRYFTVESLIELAESVGMSVEQLEGIFLKPFTSAQLQALNLSDEVIEAMCKVGLEFPQLCLGLLAELKSVGD